ncbi:MAG: TetR/AcrR family transcriptional regulator [Gemmatimonadota bacterium]
MQTMTADGRTEGFRPPTQARSRATLARIAAATDALLAERGPARVTVADVVERAKASVGSFYARFDDKDAAIRYVHERFWAELRARWERWLEPERWRDAEPVAVVAGVIRMLVRIQFREASRLRAFMIDALTRPDGELIRRTAELDRHVAERVAALLAETDRGLADPASRRVAASGFQRVLSAVRDDVMLGRLPGPEPDVTARERILVLTRMYAGLLDLDGAPRSYAALLRLCASARRAHGRPEAVRFDDRG